MIHAQTQQEATPDTRPKWFNSPISFHEGNISDIANYLPQFERRAFALTQPGKEQTRLNERLDTIVRKPFGKNSDFIPVGVVSKEYALVQHTEVVDTATKALTAIQVDPKLVKTELKITEYGERMAISMYLPDEYSFDPGDGHPLALRLECFNSVDGSTRFRALMGWFRFVCSNGLIIGITRSDLRRRHIGDVSLFDVGAILISGIEESENEKLNFQKWAKHKLRPEEIAGWIEKDLRKGWGFKAAARTYHISRTGFDVDVLGPYKDNTPSTVPVRQTTRVPGTPTKSDNLFQLSQILAWLAKERRDVQEQLEWRERIPDLLKPLLN